MTVTHATAAAPVRLDLAGAWTDVAPFATDVGGAVVNAALAVYAHAEYVPGGDAYRLRSDDLQVEAAGRTPDDLPAGGPLDLLAATIRRWRPPPGLLRTWSEAPAGAGLGGSGALGVALVAAIGRAMGHPLDRHHLAAEAWQLETVDAARAGGKQDQYAAAFGGLHRFGFSAGGVTVQPLRLPGGFADTLARHLIVCYTGQSRLSSHAITRVMQAFRDGHARVVTALHRLAALADEMAAALEAGDLALIGTLLSANWKAQQELDDGMRTAPMARLESAMHTAGAMGGKAAGAGAGGSMFFLVPEFDSAAAAARSAGASVIPVAWADSGVTVR